MPIGDVINDPIPPVGTAGTSYASQLVAFLTEVKSRLESRVALTSLLAGIFDLSNNPLTNVKYLGLYEQLAAPTTPVGSLQRYGNNLYYVSAAGAVRITNGAALDAVAVDGITGDYTAPAEFKYTLGDTTYSAYSDTGTTPDTWAYLAARAVDIYGGAQSTVRARLTFAGVGSYTITVPAAAPAVQSLVQMSTAGVLSLGGSGVDHDVVLASTRNFEVSGGGKYKRSGLTVTVPAVFAGTVNGAGSGCTNNGSNPGVGFPTSSTNYLPLPSGLDSDATINLITLQFSAAVTSGVVARLYNTLSTGSFDYLSITTAGSGGSQIILDCSPGLSASTLALWLRIVTDGSSNPFLTKIIYTYSV